MADEALLNETPEVESATETPEYDATETPVAEAPAEPKYDAAAHQKSVGDKLADIFKEDTEDDADEDDEAGEQDAAADEDGEEADETDEEAAPAAKETPSAEQVPTLPAAHVRSLKAYGWTDAEIIESHKTLGSRFLDTAARIHKNRNDEVNQWAEAGRQKRQQTQTPPAADPKAPAQQPPATGALAALKPVDVAALKQQYGDDGMIDAIAAPVNATIAAINAILPQLEAGRSHAQEAEQANLTRQIEQFFGGEELKPYNELYGADVGKAKQDQVDARSRVLETADALIAGAELQGRKLTVQDALIHAHDIVSADFKVKAAKATITKAAKDRNKGITLRPTSKGATSNAPLARSARPRTRGQMESRTANRLKAVFG